MRIAILSVFFPEIETYINDFLNSLRNQTYKEFDLIIFDDCLENIGLYTKSFSDLRIHVIRELNLTPIDIRFELLKHCQNNDYDIAMFADADDYFSNNKIEISCKQLVENDIIVHDLNTIDSIGNVINSCYLSNRLTSGQNIKPEMIIHSNFMGLGNCVFKVECIPLIPRVKNLVAFDWYFFTIMLRMGYKCIFTNDIQTYYRMHDGNTIGINDISTEKIKTTIKVKRLHYSALKNLYPIYSDLADRFQSDKFHIDSDINYPFWWEQVK